MLVNSPIPFNQNSNDSFGPRFGKIIEGPLGKATPPPAIYDPESCGSDRQKWSAHQDRPIADDGLNWLDIC